MPPIDDDIYEALLLARSALRDLAHGWTASELVETPRELCDRITRVLGDDFVYSVVDDGVASAEPVEGSTAREPDSEEGTMSDRASRSSRRQRYDTDGSLVVGR